MLISKLKSHGVTIDEEEAVSKFLHSVPAKYIQIALSIETMLDLSTLTIEDVAGRLQAVDERLGQATATKDSGKLLLTEEEWAARRNSGKAASSSRGGKGKHETGLLQREAHRLQRLSVLREDGPLDTGVPKSQEGKEGSGSPGESR